MDKSSNSMKIEKIRRAMEAEDFEKALDIAKTVDSARMKSAADLGVVAEAYYKNGAYDTALVYYEQIYLKNRSRRILINLINLCLKLSMADMAESYLNDFIDMAPGDFYRYIFRYRIDKLRQASYDVLIHDLECLKEENYMEDWAYELAKLYHKSGQSEKCVAECDDIILWFGEGVYVDRARGLRAVNLDANASIGEGDADLVREVHRLMLEGKSAEEVEDFIEESTMTNEHSEEYTEEDYRSERYGAPVYEEEGRDVIWNTGEFGPVTEEMIRQQNTMDMLEGMQVAQQLRMQLGEDREMEVAGVEEAGTEDARMEKIEADETGTEESRTEETGTDAEKAVKESGEPVQRAGSRENTAGETVRQETEVQKKPAKKSLWERRREAKELRRREQEETERRRKEQAEKKQAEEQEVEDSLYRMLEQEEQEEELSRSIRAITDSGEEAEDAAESESAAAADEGKETAEAEQATREFQAVTEQQISEAENASAEESEEEQKKPQDIRKEKAGAESEQGTEPEKASEIPMFEYPKEILTGVTEKESPEFYRRLKNKGMHADEFFSGYLASANVRKQILRAAEQLFDSRNRNMLLMITGEPRSGKTTLAKAFAKCVHNLGRMNSPRVAVIRGEKLNRMHLAEKKEQLKDTTLIIENASALDDAHLAELISLTAEFAGVTGVILEDERTRMNQLLRRNNEMNRIYNVRIHLPKWTVEDLFLHSLSVLASHEYQMPKPVADQFLENVRTQIEQNRENAYEAVLGYTEAVVERTETRMAETLREYAKEGRYREVDLMLIREEDLGGSAQ